MRDYCFPNVTLPKLYCNIARELQIVVINLFSSIYTSFSLFILPLWPPDPMRQESRIEVHFEVAKEAATHKCHWTERIYFYKDIL